MSGLGRPRWSFKYCTDCITVLSASGSTDISGIVEICQSVDTGISKLRLFLWCFKDLSQSTMSDLSVQRCFVSGIAVTCQSFQTCQTVVMKIGST